LSSAEVRTHSALHVLKGAVVKVLGPRRTTSTQVVGDHGALTVELDKRPSAEEVRAIEDAANGKMAENVEVLQFEMEREEAEGHFGNAIYDAFPVPEAVTLLTILRITDWEVNCCSEKHVETTGEVGRIKIEGVRFRNAKRLLELEFSVQD
jgi:alanyl-tRNA synthetase